MNMRAYTVIVSHSHLNKELMRDVMDRYNNYNNISHTVSTVGLLFKLLTITFLKKNVMTGK